MRVQRGALGARGAGGGAGKTEPLCTVGCPLPHLNAADNLLEGQRPVSPGGQQLGGSLKVLDILTVHLQEGGQFLDHVTDAGRGCPAGGEPGTTLSLRTFFDLGQGQVRPGSLNPSKWPFCCASGYRHGGHVILILTCVVHPPLDYEPPEGKCCSLP